MRANRQANGDVSAECHVRAQESARLAQSSIAASAVASLALVLVQASGKALRQSRGSAIALANAALAIACDAAFALDPGVPSDERIFASGLEPNVVFVTSTTHTGNLGGLAGADAICQAGAFNAGLHGTYRAWLSATGVNALSRLGAARGWIRTDGQPVADTPSDLASGLFHPIDVDENGSFVDNSAYLYVYTATLGDGSYFGQNCSTAGSSDWSTTSARTVLGICTSSSATFTDAQVLPCATTARLYCFGVDAIHPVAP